jgi:hypothetical protein
MGHPCDDGVRAWGSDRVMTAIGASREVIEHHARLHDRTCPNGDAVVLMCEHRRTVVFVCTECLQTVFGVFAPGDPCHHAAEVRDGRAPSGVWTEVAT